MTTNHCYNPTCLSNFYYFRNSRRQKLFFLITAMFYTQLFMPTICLFFFTYLHPWDFCWYSELQTVPWPLPHLITVIKHVPGLSKINISKSSDISRALTFTTRFRTVCVHHQEPAVTIRSISELQQMRRFNRTVWIQFYNENTFKNQKQTANSELNSGWKALASAFCGTCCCTSQ